MFFFVCLCIVMSNILFLRSEFRIVMSTAISAQNTMFGSNLPPVVCRKAHVLSMLFVFLCE